MRERGRTANTANTALARSHGAVGADGLDTFTALITVPVWPPVLAGAETRLMAVLNAEVSPVVTVRTVERD